MSDTCPSDSPTVVCGGSLVPLQPCSGPPPGAVTIHMWRRFVFVCPIRCHPQFSSKSHASGKGAAFSAVMLGQGARHTYCPVSQELSLAPFHLVKSVPRKE